MLQRDNEIEKWNKFYKIGGISAILIVLLIPIQIFIFIKFPPPENTLGFFELFDKNWFLGLLSLDLLYIFSNTLLLLVYLGLFSALRHTNFAYMLIAIVIGFVGITAYFSSTVCFEMLSLSKQYQLAESIEVKNQLIAAGHNFLATYKGTAFDIYYVFNAISLIIISRVMFQDKKFNKTEA
ncbi:MAG: hypothetical protein GWP06_05690, partial [Actinobacteria bacterium]|nr:hypothetical protein [Actinomycetota bacterium]